MQVELVVNYLKQKVVVVPVKLFKRGEMEVR